MVRAKRTLGDKAKPEPERRNGERVNAGGTNHLGPGPADAWSRLACSGWLQPKLTVNVPGDRHEQEADRVADHVLRMPDPGAADTGAAPLSIQRMCAECEEEEAQRTCAACAAERQEVGLQAKEKGSAPRVTPRTEARIRSLRGGGEPLPAAVRGYFDPRFGRSFGAVRVHTGSEAADVAREVRARAFTVGRDIAFATGEFQPETEPGRRLLAHELVHTVQQGATGAGAETTVARSPDDETGGGGAGGGGSPWKSGKKCDRDNRENTDFPSTHIDRVNVDLSDMTTGLTLHWVNPTALTLPTGGFPISPGAGVCCVDCDDTTVSQTAHTDCTPKGNWRVHNKACVLGGTSWARNPTYFSRAGIAIHAGDGHLPGYPASHGCVRTTGEASAIVHDNTIYSSRYAADPERGLPDRRTEVVVSGTWSSPRCYPTENARRSVPRSTACSGGSGKGSGGTKDSTEETGGTSAPTGGVEAAEPEDEQGA